MAVIAQARGYLGLARFVIDGLRDGQHCRAKAWHCQIERLLVVLFFQRASRCKRRIWQFRNPDISQFNRLPIDHQAFGVELSSNVSTQIDFGGAYNDRINGWLNQVHFAMEGGGADAQGSDRGEAGVVGQRGRDTDVVARLSHFESAWRNTQGRGRVGLWGVAGLG